MKRLFWRIDSEPPRHCMNLNSAIWRSVTRSCSRPVLPAPSDTDSMRSSRSRICGGDEHPDGVDYNVDLPCEILDL